MGYCPLNNILDSARGKSFIGEGLYSKQLSEKYTNKDVAREFLENAVSRFMMGSSEFDAFLEIFDSTPSLEIVSKRIREALAAETSGSKDCDSDVITSFSSSSYTSLVTGGGFDSALPQGMAPYPSQQEPSSEKKEVVTGNVMAKLSVTEGHESGTFTVRTFSAQRGYSEESEPGKHVEERSIEAVDRTATSVPNIKPYSSYDQVQRMIRSEKDEAKVFVQRSVDALRQVKEDLQDADYSPNFSSEVQDTSKNYQKYMVGVEKKEAEIEELRETYEKKLEMLLKDKDEQVEQEKEDLRCEYEKNMEKLFDEIKQLKDQTNIRDSNFKMQVMAMTIEYSNKMAKLKDEKLELKDEISKLKDEIFKLKDTNSSLMGELNQSKLDDRDRKIKELEERLQQHETDIKTDQSPMKRLMETGEHT